MPILNTPRAGRKQEGYMETLLTNMYTEETVIYKMGYGVCDINPEILISSFYSVQNTFCKFNPIKVHYMEIYIEKEFGIEIILSLADLFGRYLYGQGFQCYISTIDSDLVYF